MSPVTGATSSLLRSSRAMPEMSPITGASLLRNNSAIEWSMSRKLVYSTAAEAWNEPCDDFEISQQQTNGANHAINLVEMDLASKYKKILSRQESSLTLVTEQSKQFITSN